MTKITRFAPSPNGLMHLGHAYAARCAVQTAGTSGTALIRFEDIDQIRCKPEYELASIETLAWLGLSFTPSPFRQSERFRAYQNALTKLKERSLIYPCFCSRKQVLAEIEASGNAPQMGIDGIVYPGTCRALSVSDTKAEQAKAWRLDVRKALALIDRPLAWYEQNLGPIKVRAEAAGDFVIARQAMPTSYHLSVVIDDAQQSITHVTRAADLYQSTHIHVLLQALLGLPTPQYAHHSVLVDQDGKRFAKRDQSRTLASLRTAGKTPDQVWGMIDACSKIDLSAFI